MNYKKSIVCLLSCTLLGSNSKHIYVPETWDNSLYFSYKATSSMNRYYDEFVITSDSIYHKSNDPDTNQFSRDISQIELNYLLKVLKNQHPDKISPVYLKSSSQSCPSFSICLNSGDKRLFDFSISKNQILRSADWNKHNQILYSIYKIINNKFR